MRFTLGVAFTLLYLLGCNANKCAVVFPSITVRSRGGEINAFDAVFRFNSHQPTAPRDIASLGNKTTYRLINGQVVNVNICLTLPGICVVSWPKEEIPIVRQPVINKLTKHTNHRRVKFIELNTFHSCVKTYSNCAHRNIIARGKKISTGFKGVCFAASMCEEITVFGIDDEQHESNKLLEYDTHAPMWIGHDFFGEHTCLIDTMNITII